MLKILSVSDTHGRNERWEKIIKKELPDLVLHSGDHCTSENIMNLYANYWVAGNNDYIGNEIEFFKIEDLKFLLLHGHQANRSNYEIWKNKLSEFAKPYNPDVLVYGHSHIQDIDEINGIKMINPGSLELPRNKEMRPTYVTFEVDKNEIKNLKVHFYDFN